MYIKWHRHFGLHLAMFIIRKQFAIVIHNLVQIALFFTAHSVYCIKKIFCYFNRISRSFKNNFMQFLREFHPILRKFHSIFKKISPIFKKISGYFQKYFIQFKKKKKSNFQEYFMQFLRKFH